jgi:hypothetical protein
MLISLLLAAPVTVHGDLDFPQFVRHVLVSLPKLSSQKTDLTPKTHHHICESSHYRSAVSST